MAKIIITSGEDVVQEVVLSKARMTLGRRLGNDIVLDNMAVSSEHAVIFNMAGDLFLEDQNSKNGTQINGVPVKKHLLRHNDVIQLAHFKIVYSTDDSGSEMHVAPAIVKMLNGDSAGKEIPLTKLITTIGKLGIHVAVITQRREAYFLTHVEGGAHPLVNGESIGAVARELMCGDVIDLSGAQLSFGRRE